MEMRTNRSRHYRSWKENICNNNSRIEQRRKGRDNNAEPYIMKKKNNSEILASSPGHYRDERRKSSRTGLHEKDKNVNIHRLGLPNTELSAWSVKKKRERQKDNIFRFRKNNADPSFAARLLVKEGVAKALCFANPVRDPVDLYKEDSSVANTLDTTDDTITSSMYFDAQYSHKMEKSPAMPLFTEYKVKSSQSEKNTLMEIISSGSHQSIHMLNLEQPDGVSRRLFVPANGQEDQNDDIQVVCSGEIEFESDTDTSSSSRICTTTSSNEFGLGHIQNSSRNITILSNSYEAAHNFTLPDVKLISDSHSSATPRIRKTPSYKSVID